MAGPPTPMTQAIAAVHAPAGSLPRLLAGVQPRGALTLEQHLAVHGPLAPLSEGRRRAQRRERAAELIGEIERSELLGRGGAGFPTATKMRAVASSRGRAVVLANAAEGEPASLKDRTLLETVPHLVLDGAILAAEALGADELIVCACASADVGAESMELAIRERESEGRRSLRMELAILPSAYVAGQESALVNFLDGGPAKPTFTPPLPFQSGLHHRPTLINNVETLAHVALIARHGAEWFRALGTASQPGSALVTLSGPVLHPGVYEIEHGASLSSLIDAAGGSTGAARGALLGGYAGAWIAPEHLPGVALSREHLAVHGASLGAGIVILLSEHACPVAETARVVRWMAGQSAGQCGPCVFGLDALARSVEELAAGTAGTKATKRIERLAALSGRRGACHHPDGVVNLLLSALEAFETQFADHARHGPCEACARVPELPLPAWPVQQSPRRKALVPR